MPVAGQFFRFRFRRSDPSIRTVPLFYPPIVQFRSRRCQTAVPQAHNRKRITPSGRLGRIDVVLDPNERRPDQPMVVEWFVFSPAGEARYIGRSRLTLPVMGT